MTRTLRKTLVKKLKDTGGETLVELLVSILVGTLSVALLLGGVAASSTIDRAAETSDDAFYQALNDAEEKTTPADTATATVKEGARSVTFDIDVYGGDGVWSYQEHQTGGGGDG